MWGFSKAKLYAALAFLAALALAWLRRDARKDAYKDMQMKDYENAQDIHDDVSRNRADPNRLREHEGDGWRD